MKKDNVPDLTIAQETYRDLMIHQESCSDAKERSANETSDSLYYVVSDDHAKAVLDRLGIKY